jgi:chromosome segregation ATPase
MRVPLPQAARGEALLRELAGSLPQLDVAPFMAQLDALRADIDGVRRFATEGAAAEKAATTAALKRQLEAKDGLIAALKAQVRGLQERVAAEGSIPAGCVATSNTYKAAVAEKQALEAQVSQLHTQLANQTAHAAAAQEKLATQTQAQVAATKAKGQFEWRLPSCEGAFGIVQGECVRQTNPNPPRPLAPFGLQHQLPSLRRSGRLRSALA